MTTNQNLVFTGRIDTLYDVLSKIDLALSQMQNGNFKSATNTLSDAGNALQCHIELNSDQSVRNTVSTKWKVIGHIPCQYHKYGRVER